MRDYRLKVFQPRLDSPDILYRILKSNAFKALILPGRVLYKRYTPNSNALKISDDLTFDEFYGIKNIDSWDFTYIHFVNEAHPCLRLTIRFTNGKNDVPSGIILEFTTMELMDGIVSAKLLTEFLQDVIAITLPKFVYVYDIGDLLDGESLKVDLSWFQGIGEKDVFPLEPHWMSYYNPPLVEKIGRERFANLAPRVIPIGESYLVITTEEVFDVTNPEHVQLAQSVINTLALERFIVE